MFVPWIFFGRSSKYILRLGRAACPGKYLIEGHRPGWAASMVSKWNPKTCSSYWRRPGASPYTIEFAYPKLKLIFFWRLRVFHRQITCVQPTLGIGRQWDGSKYMGLPKNREPPNLMVCHHSLVWNCNFAGVPHSQSHPGYPWITIKTPLYI